MPCLLAQGASTASVQASTAHAEHLRLPRHATNLTELMGFVRTPGVDRAVISLSLVRRPRDPHEHARYGDWPADGGGGVAQYLFIRPGTPMKHLPKCTEPSEREKWSSAHATPAERRRRSSR